MTDLPENLVRRTPWPEATTRPVATPIQPSVVYASDSPDQLDAIYSGRQGGYTYAREGHPNATVLAAKIDALEHAPAAGGGGIIVGSGMAAVSAVALGLLSAGDHVVAGVQLYGRSLRLLTQDMPRFGIATTLADPTDAGAIEAAIRPETRLIVVEVVSNPTLRVADMEAIHAIARARAIRIVVDNTFTTPRGYRPFDHGADIVLHSVTKILAGHADATLGYVAARDPKDRAKLYDIATTTGMTPSPFDCWLAERGLQSFHLRYDRSEENAARLADHLASLTGVRRVVYPMRPDHPDHNRAVALLGGRGGHMVSFEIDGGRAAANALTRAMPGVAFAPTLGDIGTTLSHPASSSHRNVAEADRLAQGVSEGFFRASVGVEDFALLARDFSAGVAAAVAAA
jgi:cystathionine gamma-synthase